MSEIEKLYANAEVKPFRYCYNCVDNNGNRIENSANCPSRHNCSNTCDTPEYEFTAEKQLELIKWLVVNKEIFTIHYKHRFLYCCEEDRHSSACQENFEESLAALVNVIWQDLTKEEKAEIRKILEG